jgi:hypothetical protein
MIKSAFISILLVFSCSASAVAKGMYKPAPRYKLTDLGFDSTLLAGTVHISGTVFAKEEVRKGALVSTDSRADEVRTDSEGKYELLLELPAPALTLVCVTKGYEEITVRNRIFAESHRYELHFYFNKEKSHGNMTVKKPVIYLYSEKARKVSVQLQPKASLSFSYPFLENGWNFNLSSKGLESPDGKTYPYLFWEAEHADLNYQFQGNELPGSIVEKENVVEFLEKQLLDLGLNQKEQTDFITFWAPLMIKHDACFVQFILDEDYSAQIADIKIQPPPEASRRLYMMFTSIEEIDLEGVRIIDQKFNQFERKDYTLIEWGGSEISHKLQP